MKAKAVSIHSNKLLVQTFIVMSLAFLFSISANAAPLKTTAAKKPVKAKKTTSVPAAVQGSTLSSKIDPINEVYSLAKKDVEFGASFVLGTNQSLTENARRSYSGTYTFSPSLSHGASNTSLAAVLEYNREYSYELDDRTDGDWSNGLIKVTKKIPVNGLIDNVLISPRVSIGLGNEARRQTYKAGIGSTFSVDKKIGRVTLAQSASYAYRHFEYDIRDDGTVNSPHQLEENTSIGFAATDWMELQASFGLSFLRSFQGVNRTFSTTVLGANFSINKAASIGIGATTLRKNTLEPSGRGNRVKFWDSTDALAFIELGLSI